MRSAPSPPLSCIDCGTPLTGGDHDLGCPGCGRRFDVVAGIPDLRPPLAGFDTESDRRLAVALEDAGAQLDLAGLLARYWASRPDVAGHLAQRFVRGDLVAADRAQEVVVQIEDLADRRPHGADLALEVGCGTAALGAALARQARHVVVSDVSLAWLVLARRRIADAGLDNMTVVACTGDRIPFPDETFDLVVAADVIEHVPDGADLVLSCSRVLRTGRAMWLATPNRFSLTLEPHVKLWGVGFLPRGAGARYVRRFRQTAYEDIHTFSRRELRGVLELAGRRNVVVAQTIVPTSRAGYGRVGRVAIDLYNAATRRPFTSAAVSAIAPLFHAVVWKDGTPTTVAG